MMRKRALSWSLLSVLFPISVWPSAPAQPEAFSCPIEPGLGPAVDALSAIGGVGDPRPVGAVLDPDGVHGDYMVNEAILSGFHATQCRPTMVPFYCRGGCVCAVGDAAVGSERWREG